MKYRIVEGLPSNVEKEVQQLLDGGWQLNGQLLGRQHDGYHLLVQGLIMVEENDETINELVDRVLDRPEADAEPKPEQESIADLIGRVIGPQTSENDNVERD